jgi:hypothetical protein
MTAEAPIEATTTGRPRPWMNGPLTSPTTSRARKIAQAERSFSRVLSGVASEAR